MNEMIRDARDGLGAGLLACVAIVALLAGAGAAEPDAPRTPYDQLDQGELARRLSGLGMSELLGELVKEAGESGGVEARGMLVQALMTQAKQAADQARRDQLIDQALAELDKLIAETGKSEQPRDVLANLRFRMDRVIYEGIVKCDPYVERMEYFLGTEEDRVAVAKLTAGAIRRLDAMTVSLENAQVRWGGNNEYLVLGHLDRIEMFLAEAHFQGAYVRYFRAVSLPAADATRGGLLRQAIVDLQAFANDADNEQGVKFRALALSGSAARELGEFDNARVFLKRADHADAKPGTRLKAKFETVRTYIDQKNFAEAAKQLATFRTEASALAKATGIPQVAVDLQASLLEYKRLNDQGESMEKTDPAKAKKLKDQAIGTLLKLMDEHPQYAAAIADLLAKKKWDTDHPGVLMIRGRREFAKRTEEGNTAAEELLKKVLDSQAAGKEFKAQSLWLLGHIRNRQTENLQAAAYWVRLAREYPEDANAKTAARNAVISYEAIMKEKGKPAEELGLEFIKGYTEALHVLTNGWGKTDKDIQTRYYELGLMYDLQRLWNEAIAAFQKVPNDSKLYIPSQYRILQQRVGKLLDDVTMSKEERKTLARDLIGEMERFQARSREYAGSTKEQAEADAAREWGADCGMMISKLHKDVLGDLERAIAQADKTAAEWKVAGIEDRARDLRIQVRLDQGRAVEIIDDLKKLMKDDPERARDVLLSAVDQIGERIERLSYDVDPKSEEQARNLRAAYKDFAVELNKVAQAQGMSAEQMVPIRRALAYAYETGSPAEVQKGLDLYKELKAQAGEGFQVLRGMARCHRALGNAKEAVDGYTNLIPRLPPRGPAWWRTQLEAWTYITELGEKNKSVDVLGKVPIQVNVLQYEDKSMGGYWQQFNRLEGRAKSMLEQLGPATRAATTAP